MPNLSNVRYISLRLRSHGMFVRQWSLLDLSHSYVNISSHSFKYKSTLDPRDMAPQQDPAMTDLYLETNPIMPEEKLILEEGEVFNCCQVLILDKYQDYIEEHKYIQYKLIYYYFQDTI